MRRWSRAAAGCTLLALLACSAAPQRPDAIAELVILDGAVITENPAQPQASALAVRDGKIAYVGDAAGARRWIGSDTRVLRVAGATVLPGLIDSHIHVMEGVLAQSACSFADAPLDVAQIAPIIRDRAARMLGREAEVGSLSVGKAADLIVLDRHLDDSSPSAQVLATRVRYTFMDGTMLVGSTRP